VIIRKLEQSGNALKCHIISAGLWLDYLQTSLFISKYQTAVRIISPVESVNEASHVQYKLWENCDLTVLQVIMYIVWANLCILFLPYFSNGLSGIENKRN
jgi:hypothetical protein